jgi:predicted RNA-binding protein with PIN domain
MELVTLLQEFSRLRRQPVEVYFDGAPAGHAGIRKLGAVRAHFIRLGHTADSAIRVRLNGMGKSAKNWTVVSSDREVQSAARVNQAGVVSSEEFVKLLKTTIQTAPKTASNEAPVAPKEVDEWLKIFGNGGE